MIKDQVIVVAAEATMQRHAPVLQALINAQFPLSVIVQFLVDYVANEETRFHPQLQALLLDWHEFIDRTVFITETNAVILRSPAFDAAFYDLYLAISRTQALLTALSQEGVVSTFMFDGWLNCDFRLRRRHLVPESNYNGQ